MALIDLYVKYLEKEGYRPVVDGSLVEFKSEGGNYAIAVDANDAEYFQLVFPNFWKIDNVQERQQAVRCADEATRQCKVAKVYLTGDGSNVIADVEEFLGRREDFQAIFPRAMSALRTAVRIFADAMKKG
jgi:hypothetical protein